MSGAPSDSYGHGLFRTASAGNMARRYKALHRKMVARPRRAVKITPAPRVSPKRDEVAELLSQGFDFAAVAEQMGLTTKAVRKHFDAIRKQLGWQAQ